RPVFWPPSPQPRPPASPISHRPCRPTGRAPTRPWSRDSSNRPTTPSRPARPRPGWAPSEVSMQDVIRQPASVPARATRLSFVQALNTAMAQAMELDPGVFVYGIGADGKAGIFGSAVGLVERFGPQRVLEPPIREGGR